ncbi:MAG: hypothetical protein M3371_13140 [Acidobacteriota bacterium]|nr:hypothetical protein [Acidobacteriota bacterium]
MAKDVGSQATPEVMATWKTVYQLFQKARGDRRERLQQVADELGVSFKVARRRLRNYEGTLKAGNRDRLSEASDPKK